ncbi:MAG: fimbrillin family protein [Bacteroidaceae bacterium]|nr:fimbrillin family protein [Bacteroidaceae bacterium]
MMRRKLITMSIAAMLVASCTQEDQLLLLRDGEQAIKFGKVETRAEVTDANQILEFGVFAEMNLGADGPEEPVQYINLLSNERVYRSNASSDWSYDNKRYWVNDRTFHFFAVYPLLDNSKITPFVSEIVPSNPYTCYKINWDTPSEANDDLMTASATMKTTEGQTVYPAVNFQFEHALAKVNINVQKAGANTDNKVIVRSITISNIKKSGTYNSENKTWQISEGTGNAMNYTRNNLKVELELEVDDLDNKVPIPTSVISGLLFIPQEITENSIQITVGYTFDGDTYSAQAFIPTTTVREWESAKEYTYNLVLGERKNNILFGIPTVSAWLGSERPVGGTIIIQ